MRRIGTALALLFGLAAANAYADEQLLAEKFWVAPNAGSLGIGMEGGWRWNDYWGGRVGINGGALSFTYHDKDSDLVSRLKLLSAGVTADYYPFAGDFRVSAGARLSATSVDGHMRNLKKHAKNGVTLVIPDPLTDFTISQNAVQPYLGVGYQMKIDERVTLNFDFGALYAGNPDLSVTSHADRFGFTKQQIRREIERARDRMSAFQVYPVVQVGLNIRF